MSIVLTDSKHYTDIANAIREKNGKTDTYKPSEMAAAIEEISGGGGGSALDYTVTVNDADGQPRAIYSVKNGVGNIAEPSGISRKKWVDEDGNTIKFPINPSRDMVVTANNDVLLSELLWMLYQDIPDVPEAHAGPICIGWSSPYGTPWIVILYGRQMDWVYSDRFQFRDCTAIHIVANASYTEAVWGSMSAEDRVMYAVDNFSRYILDTKNSAYNTSGLKQKIVHDIPEATDFESFD